MKKVLLTAVAAMAIFAMTACGNNNQPAEATDTAAVEAAATEQCDKQCDKHCEGDTAACCKQGEAVEGQACEKQCCKKAEGQGCEKQCDKKCEKAQ